MMKEGGFCRGKGLIKSENLDGGEGRGGVGRVAYEQALGREWGGKGRRSPRACLRARRGERGGIKENGAI